MEESLEGWSYVLERQRMKVSRSTTEYVCVTESEGGVTEKMQGAEVVKTDMFNTCVVTYRQCTREVKERVQSGWSGWR